LSNERGLEHVFRRKFEMRRNSPRKEMVCGEFSKFSETHHKFTKLSKLEEV
jgi:hypothetical protein